MGNLIKIEFLKLRRKTFPWVMMCSALIMPFLAFLVFKFAWETGGDPIRFYKWSALNFTPAIILPVNLGILSTFLMYNEEQHHTYQQIWIVPVNRMGYFFIKFFVVFIYSFCFMTITAICSITLSIFLEELSDIALEWDYVSYLLKKCLEFGVILPFTVLPILAVATAQKGYILSTSFTLIYIFSALFLMPVNMYAHPLSNMMFIVARNGDIPELVFTQTINVPLAIFSIGLWNIISLLYVNIKLRRR